MNSDADAGGRTDATDRQEGTDGRPDNCACHSTLLPCWPCWQNNFRESNPALPGKDADADDDVRTDGGRDRDPCRHASLVDPSGGCPHCGRETTAVDVTDFGDFERGQLCPDCGLVHVPTEGSR